MDGVGDQRVFILNLYAGQRVYFKFGATLSRFSVNVTGPNNNSLLPAVEAWDVFEDQFTADSDGLYRLTFERVRSGGSSYKLTLRDRTFAFQASDQT